MRQSIIPFVYTLYRHYKNSITKDDGKEKKMLKKKLF